MLHATEGVWGLAVDPFNEEAVYRLLALKQRTVTKGLIVIGDCAEVFESELGVLPACERDRVVRSWPGPVSWIVPNRSFPWWITGGRSEVAVRVPGHSQARALCRAFGGALVSTSANISRQPTAQSILRARSRLPRASYPESVDYILPGTTGGRRQPSEIRNIAGRSVRR